VRAKLHVAHNITGAHAQTEEISLEMLPYLDDQQLQDLGVSTGACMGLLRPHACVRAGGREAAARARVHAVRTMHARVIVLQPV
jgi:hypothetical protein